MTREELIAEKLVERLYKMNDELIEAAEKQQKLLEKRATSLQDVFRAALVGLAAGASVAWLVLRFV